LTKKSRNRVEREKKDDLELDLKKKKIIKRGNKKFRVESKRKLVEECEKKF
jgi:hypothetical protein